MPIMSEEPKKEDQGCIHSKRKAYLYLKGLIEKSDIFREKVENLRKNLNITLDNGKDLPWQKIKPFKDGKPSKKHKLSEKQIGRFKKHTERLEAYICSPQLEQNKKFINLCEYYYIPTEFWHKLEIFIYTDNAKSLLTDGLKSSGALGATPGIVQKDFLVPHVVVYVPIGTEKQELENYWPVIEETFQETNYYWFQDNGWGDSISFDRAMKAYKIHKKSKISEKDLEEKMRKTKYFKGRVSGSRLDTKEIYRWIRRIGDQIESLQKWQSLEY